MAFISRKRPSTRENPLVSGLFGPSRRWQSRRSGVCQTPGQHPLDIPSTGIPSTPLPGRYRRRDGEHWVPLLPARSPYRLPDVRIVAPARARSPALPRVRLARLLLRLTFANHPTR